METIKGIKIQIKIDSRYNEPEVVVLTSEVTEEVNEIVKRISDSSPKIIAGFKDDTLEILDNEQIIRAYTENGKVFAVTSNGKFLIKMRLYQLESRLEAIKNSTFCRISNSEIINLKKAKNFDLSLAGTICVRLSDGDMTYVSRRYVTKIKQVLGV